MMKHTHIDCMSSLVHICLLTALIRKRPSNSCTTRGQPAWATTSWINGSSLSLSHSFSSSEMRWEVSDQGLLSHQSMCNFYTWQQGQSEIDLFSRACVFSLQTLYGGSQTCQVCGYAHQLVCEDEPQATEGRQDMSHTQSKTSGQSHKTCQKHSGHVSY